MYLNHNIWNNFINLISNFSKTYFMSSNYKVWDSGLPEEIYDHLSMIQIGKESTAGDLVIAEMIVRNLTNFVQDIVDREHKYWRDKLVDAGVPTKIIESIDPRD